MRDREEFHQEVQERQRNLVWPDPARNSRMADVFLWRGSPQPTPVQRIAACLIGVTLIGIGAVILTTLLPGDAFLDRFINALLSLGFMALGVKIGFNGVRKTKRTLPRRV